MKQYDVRGKLLEVGDTVAFGADNGSFLHFGKIGKITAKRVFIETSARRGKCSVREPSRVALLEKGK